ncbi:MAG: CotH kinase family protein [Bacteroidetes bacterium]|nr:CotH kinase family protein [Bacteroidota bacterium]
MANISKIYSVLFLSCFVLFSTFSRGQNVNTFSTELPLVIINTQGQTIVNDPKVNGNMKIISNTNGLNHFTDNANEYNGYIGIELRGSSSQNYPQKPFLFETRDATGSNLNVSLLGMPEENDWILLSNYNDKSFMRNILGYTLFQRLGHYAPRARLVDVIVNNQYQGIYILTEKIKRDKNRVDIAKLKEEDIAGEELTGGYIFKIDYWNNNDSWESPYSPINHPDFKVHFVYHDPDWDELVNQQKNYIKNYVTSFEQALYSANYKDAVQGYPNYIDVKSFIDYFLVSEISRNNDGFKKSRYFHKDKNGKIVAGPVWDFDWAWKNINECYIFKATDGSGWAYKVNNCNPGVKSPGWMTRLFYDDTFKNQVNCDYFDLRSNILSDDNIYGIIDSLYNVVKNPQVKHFQKWDVLGRNVGAPEVGAQATTYEGEVEKLQDWISVRLNWLDNNMLGECSTVSTRILADQVQYQIYPNPASTQLNILSNKYIIEFQIFDLTGKTIVRNSSLNTKLLHVDVTGFMPGMYIAKVFDNNGNVFSEKIIIR